MTYSLYQHEQAAPKREEAQLGKLFSFKDKKACYRKNYLGWDNIERVNQQNYHTEKTKYLNKQALAVMAAIVPKLERGDRVIFNHKYLSSITLCKRRQNQNIIQELKIVLDIEYHNSVTHKGKKYRHSYEFLYKQQKQENIGFSENSIGQFFARQTTPILYIENKDIEYNRSKNVQAHESNFLQNSVSFTQEEIIAQIETSKVIPLKPKHICNKRKKSTNAEIKANRSKVSIQKERKAQVVRPVFYDKPKSLADMHQLLDQSIFDELRSKSDREFSNNFIAQRVLAMSKKPKLASRNFKTRQGFIAYMAPLLKNELHDSIKTGGVDFRLLANITAADRAYQEQELFLTEIENSRQVSPEWHFKKKLASVLERSKAYKLLSTYLSMRTHENSVVISLKRDIELSELDKQLILQQAQAVYETSSAKGEYKFIDKLEIVFSENEPCAKPISQQEQKLVLPQGIWGNILQKLIEEFGQDTYRNWFSKLTATVDELNKTMTLKAPSESAKDWIERHYQSTMERIASISGFEVIRLEC
jgi:hypothetical protein